LPIAEDTVNAPSTAWRTRNNHTRPPCKVADKTQAATGHIRPGLPENRQDVFPLPVTDLQRNQPARMHQTAQLVGEYPVRHQPIRTTIECPARIMMAHIGRKPGKLPPGDVRRV
jgi:hypothetical protein